MLSEQQAHKPWAVADSVQRTMQPMTKAATFGLILPRMDARAMLVLALKRANYLPPPSAAEPAIAALMELADGAGGTTVPSSAWLAFQQWIRPDA